MYNVSYILKCLQLTTLSAPIPMGSTILLLPTSFPAPLSGLGCFQASLVQFFMMLLSLGSATFVTDVFFSCLLTTTIAS